MILAGVMFIGVAAIGELAGGTMFRHFFDWRWPTTPRGMKWWQTDERIKVVGWRLMFLLGVVLLVAGLTKAAL